MADSKRESRSVHLRLREVRTHYPASGGQLGASDAHSGAAKSCRRVGTVVRTLQLGRRRVRDAVSRLRPRYREAPLDARGGFLAVRRHCGKPAQARAALAWIIDRTHDEAHGRRPLSATSLDGPAVCRGRRRTHRRPKTSRVVLGGLPARRCAQLPPRREPVHAPAAPARAEPRALPLQRKTASPRSHSRAGASLSQGIDSTGAAQGIPKNRTMEIRDVLHRRTDLSTFVVHLTRAQQPDLTGADALPFGLAPIPSSGSRAESQAPTTSVTAPRPGRR